jgi:hypothetical protein
MKSENVILKIIHQNKKIKKAREKLSLIKILTLIDY